MIVPYSDCLIRMIRMMINRNLVLLEVKGKVWPQVDVGHDDCWIC